MAIQPIDLQTMYSQMATVASNVARQQDETKMSEEVKQSAIVRQNSEQAKRVKKAASEETDTMRVQADGKQNGKKERSAAKDQKRKPEKPESDEPDDDIFQEPYLGRHIDITR
jgi:hypothetical protein